MDEQGIALDHFRPKCRNYHRAALVAFLLHEASEGEDARYFHGLAMQLYFSGWPGPSALG